MAGRGDRPRRRDPRGAHGAGGCRGRADRKGTPRRNRARRDARRRDPGPTSSMRPATRALCSKTPQPWRSRSSRARSCSTVPDDRLARESSGARASGRCQFLARLEGLRFWAAIRDSTVGVRTHLVDPDLWTITSHVRSVRGGLARAGSATNHVVATASPMTRIRSGSTLLAALGRSSTETPAPPYACLAADTSGASARREVASCPV